MTDKNKFFFMVIHLTDFLQYMLEWKFYDEFIVNRIAHEKEKEG